MKCPELPLSFVVFTEVELSTDVPCVCDKLFDADYSLHDFNWLAGRLCREEILS
jgi:hypothetical protein